MSRMHQGASLHCIYVITVCHSRVATGGDPTMRGYAKNHNELIFNTISGHLKRDS